MEIFASRKSVTMRTRVENKSTCVPFVRIGQKDPPRLRINIFIPWLYLTKVEICGHLQLGLNDFDFSLKSLRLTEIHRKHLYIMVIEPKCSPIQSVIR